MNSTAGHRPGTDATYSGNDCLASTRVGNSAVPEVRVLQDINPFVSAILRSPFHRVLSGQALLLT